MYARTETAGHHLHVYVCRCALSTKKNSPRTSPPALGMALWPFFHQKSGFGGVFGWYLALFWPTKACFGLKRAKIGPNTPPKYPQRRDFFFFNPATKIKSFILFFGDDKPSNQKFLLFLEGPKQKFLVVRRGQNQNFFFSKNEANLNFF